MTVIERIDKFNEGRIPSMIDTKYEKMKLNMFSFFRGTCHLFYEDLAKEKNMIPSPATWICGDLHLENFGSFKSDNRLVYFDLNDFDEAILAPASWELLRLVTSIYVAFDSLHISSKKSIRMANLFLKSYAATLALGKPNYIEPKTAGGIVKELLTDAKKQRIKSILLKRTFKKGHKLKIMLDHPMHMKMPARERKELIAHMREWLKHDGNSPYNYEILDAAFRIAGTGSLGLNRYLLLLRSLNEVGEPYILLDMKQTVASSLAPYALLRQPEWPNPSVRIKDIQFRMQNRPPMLLSTSLFKNVHYIIQEMQPEKDSIDFKLLKNRYRDMCGVIHDMGMLTASAQLRSAGRQGSATADELVAFGKEPWWIDELIVQAEHYAEKVSADYKSFIESRGTRLKVK